MMSKLKIAVYTIAKNEEKNIRGWLVEASLADSITFCDTGSTDRTLAEISIHVTDNRRPFIHCYNIGIEPWRFDDAHNAALALVPLDADVCIPLHLDERLTPGWREQIERVWEPGKTTKLFYTYVFAHNPDGTPQVQYLQNRIHARKGYRWRGADHEGVFPYFDTAEQTVTVPELRIEHFQDRTKDRSGILKRLQFNLMENQNDPRAVFYLGREFYYYQMYQQAISLLERYLAMTMGQAPHAWERREAAEALAASWKALGG
jgi:hypothetical protein